MTGAKVKRQWITGVLAGTAVILASACQCPFSAPASSPAAVTVTLEWTDNVDLDLELWSDGPDSGGEKIGESATFPEGGGEIVKGGSGVERLNFAADSAGWIGVHFWSPGPDDDTTVTARVRVRAADGREEVLTAELDDDSNDLWFPIAVERGAWRALGIMRRQGL
jgi:hypothetical protein